MQVLLWTQPFGSYGLIKIQKLMMDFKFAKYEVGILTFLH